MADFEINKGVGREVEFKGLRAQYLFIFAAGLLAVFVMMKLVAARQHPRRILSRKRITRLINKQQS